MAASGVRGDRVREEWIRLLIPDVDGWVKLSVEDARRLMHGLQDLLERSGP